MMPSEIVEFKLKPALAECHRHHARLRYAESRSQTVFPMTAEGYQNLSDADVAALDQMLFRFGKLQDAIGQRLLPAILMAGQEWQETDAFLDKLNRLEKLGVIPSAEEWVGLRDLRNNAMHEYPDAPEINAANLNKIHAGIPALESILAHAKGYAAEHYALS